MEPIMGFVCKVSKQGPMRVLVIPKRLHGKLEGVDDEQVLVTVSSVIP